MEELSKRELLEIYEDFDISLPIKEEEFEEALDTLLTVLLHGTKWEDSVSRSSRAVRKRFPHLNDIPLICDGKECDYAKKCPVIRKMEDSEIKKLEGTDCRADRVFGIEQASSYLKELQIDPLDSTDILNVAALVRLLIQKRRIDWSIAIDGMIDTEPVVINQRTGQVYERKIVHPLIAESWKLEKQIQVLQGQLVASRKDKTALAASLSSGSNVLKDFFLNRADDEEVIDAEAIDLEEDTK